MTAMPRLPTGTAATLGRVQDAGGHQRYRIERRDVGVLHLYRGEELVDVDRENTGESREDIEQWGTAVAWAEDHTFIELWDSADTGDGWSTLIGVPFRYVTWYLEEEGVTVWEELDSTNWVGRRIEAKNLGQIYTSAASLQEVIAARDIGGVGAVRAYETTYGVVPEAATTRRRTLVDAYQRL
jgi:hypothetical protein